ncbi:MULTISPECIES: hydroxyacylglutathione hydrolase [Mameliella]|jgi:hydroxyacylglutathione hydrolase|uniref:Hydroxyacylglutathione hydrolase n=1 Tax=Mameliella alba TaxID=561184 RepID=A0A0B3RXF2_9RHOB|nr:MULTISPECIES: hydroxyacylglutathione hydrolase [Mameliella]MCR9274032.1 hydroxyacylglutathione hydrolase [Paracoccaceae bacterium]KHQ52777.1 Hydroxyacylglutathione hydrolase [Mameliella alba]MBY6117871.1 hydroxyacylglutathione hydrolase [Mameliella alba]OWV44379.1 hydroxyacylglutathione hydrolase [Mameliella alba]OWV47164.1 hydroxyacylglutathione hydrolase [Mameliella alba]
MPLEIVTVPCLSDNYAYLVHGPDGVALIDAPEAGPIIEALEARGWSLGVIMITHHHHDHVGGVAELREKYGCPVMGPKAEVDKLPKLDMALDPGFSGGTGDGLCEVIAVPGHTLGHIAYYYPRGGAVFTADSLMALGCGRIFEGTPQMMWDSLEKLASLPPETVVYSGHEYTTANAAFALTIEPENQALISRKREIDAARAEGRPTAQVPLSVELETNPFLRATTDSVKRAVGLPGGTDAEVFAEVRARKDRF